MRAKNIAALFSITSCLIGSAIYAEPQVKISPDSSESVKTLVAPTFREVSAQPGGDNLGSHQAEGNLNMSGFSITGLIDPISDQDAVTKSYVDTLALDGAESDNLGNHIATRNIDMSGHTIENIGHIFMNQKWIFHGNLYNAGISNFNLLNGDAREMTLYYPEVYGPAVTSPEVFGSLSIRPVSEAPAGAVGISLTDTAGIDMNGYKVKDLGDPSASRDAVNYRTLISERENLLQIISDLTERVVALESNQ